MESTGLLSTDKNERKRAEEAYTKPPSQPVATTPVIMGELAADAARRENAQRKKYQEHYHYFVQRMSEMPAGTASPAFKKWGEDVTALAGRTIAQADGAILARRELVSLMENQISEADIEKHVGKIQPARDEYAALDASTKKRFKELNATVDAAIHEMRKLRDGRRREQRRLAELLAMPDVTMEPTAAPADAPPATA